MLQLIQGVILKFIIIAVIIFYPLLVLSNNNNENENTFFVIINSENSYKNKIDKGLKKIELIYKGNSKEWPGKFKATFFSRGHDNLAQKTFYKKILKMEVNEVKTYWYDNVSKGIYEPESIPNVRNLINKMSKNIGSVSVIAKSEITKFPAKIKVLYEF